MCVLRICESGQCRNRFPPSVMWVLGIRTQVLSLCSKHLPTESSLSAPIFCRLVRAAFFCLPVCSALVGGCSFLSHLHLTSLPTNVEGGETELTPAREAGKCSQCSTWALLEPWQKRIRRRLLSWNSGKHLAPRRGLRCYCFQINYLLVNSSVISASVCHTIKTSLEEFLILVCQILFLFLLQNCDYQF